MSIASVRTSHTAVQMPALSVCTAFGLTGCDADYLIRQQTHGLSLILSAPECTRVYCSFSKIFHLSLIESNLDVRKHGYSII